MWECPERKGKFKNQNQQRSGGSAPLTIEEYILDQREEIRPFLEKINETVRKALPDAREKISWRMPTYYNDKKIIIQFAAFKNHIGVYPGPEAIEAFAQKLTEFKTSKGTIQIPYNVPLPVELIEDISRWCLKNRS